MKLDLDNQERQAVARSLAERKARLIENVGDTTKPQAARRSAILELPVIASILRKLCSANRFNDRDLDDGLRKDFDCQR